MIDDNIKTEIQNIILRYKKRGKINSLRYSPIAFSQLMTLQEQERVLIKWIKNEKIEPLSNKKLLEIGCGNGNNILQFLKFGFKPENIFANELLPERIEILHENLPSKIKIISGNALEINIVSESIDVVYQSMVFSSILNKQFQNQLASKMWGWIKPGGGVLWYDFIYNNPKNKDVKGLKFNELKLLFPKGEFKKWKLTLAPPLSRQITKIHPSMYNIFNSLHFLRTHILCWIKKNK